MSENEIQFLPFDEALKIVAAIQEEEDIENSNKRILTVYNYNDMEVCWFDYEQVMTALKEEGKSCGKEEVQSFILHRIPDWALDI